MTLFLILSALALAAETLTPAAPLRVTLGAQDIMTEFVVTKGCRWLQVKFEASDGYITWSGTDGGTKDATDYLLHAADTWHEWRVPGTLYGKQHASKDISVYLSGSAASVVVGAQCMSDGT